MNSDLFARNSAELQVFRAEICAEICAEFCAENSAEFCTEICVVFRTDFHSEIPGFIAKVQIFITFYSFFAFFIMVFTMEIRSEICIFFRNSDAEFRMRNSVRKTPPVYAEILTKTAEFVAEFTQVADFLCAFAEFIKKMRAEFRIRGPYRCATLGVVKKITCFFACFFIFNLFDCSGAISALCNLLRGLGNLIRPWRSRCAR